MTADELYQRVKELDLYSAYCRWYRWQKFKAPFYRLATWIFWWLDRLVLLHFGIAIVGDMSLTMQAWCNFRFKRINAA